MFGEDSFRPAGIGWLVSQSRIGAGPRGIGTAIHHTNSAPHHPRQVLHWVGVDGGSWPSWAAFLPLCLIGGSFGLHSPSNACCSGSLHFSLPSLAKGTLGRQSHHQHLKKGPPNSVVVRNIFPLRTPPDPSYLGSSDHLPLPGNSPAAGCCGHLGSSNPALQLQGINTTDGYIRSHQHHD